MNISLHIKALLHRHDCVVVPNFGAFLVQYHSAQLDSVQHQFFPPSRKITFNAQLKNNDGLLVKHLEQSEKINYVEAQNAIHQFVNDINTALNQDGEIDFKGIGRFEYVNKQQLIFKPAETNFLTSSFGLSNFNNSPVSKTSHNKEIESPNVIELKTKEKPSQNYLKYAAVGIISIGLASAFALNWYSSEVKQHNLQVQAEAQKAVTHKIENAVFSITEPLPTLEIKQKASHQNQSVKNIHIIAGAFREEANANKKLKQLKLKGFDARMVGKNKYGLHQVAFASFTNKSEAQQALRKIKANHSPAAWLLVE